MAGVTVEAGRGHDRGAGGAAIGASAPRRVVRRELEGRIIAGVCAGLARRLDIDPLILRLAFVAAATAGGFGLVAYVLAWLFIPAAGSSQSPAARVRGRPGSWQVAAGAGLLVLSGLLLFRELGLWIGDALAWPLVLAAAGGALIWRHSAAPAAGLGPPPAVPAPVHRSADRVPSRPRALGAALPALPGRALSRAGLGAALVIGAGIVFLQLNDALGTARDVLLAALVVIVALALILAPWWWRLVRSLAEERAERIRSQERADLAAHLHDSVLQTLALMQRRADDPREVAALARRQERELRAWLSDRPPAAPGESLAAALAEAAAEVEETHGVEIEVVTVGDCPLDARAEAVVGAAREALVNAAKFAPGEPVRLYAEVTDERVQVFVRDRGPGFDPDTVPPDRRGVRESIVGRMERHGGRATVHAGEATGTEVELVMARGTS